MRKSARRAVIAAEKSRDLSCAWVSNGRTNVALGVHPSKKETQGVMLGSFSTPELDAMGFNRRNYQLRTM